MAAVKITPEELRAAADTLEASARVIHERAGQTAEVVNQVVLGGRFQGNLAASYIARYQRTAETMQNWPGQLAAFANLLRQAADRFEGADRAEQGGGHVLGAAAMNPAFASSDPAFAYVSAANKPLYDEMLAAQKELSTTQSGLKSYQMNRQALAEYLENLKARLEGRNFLERIGDQLHGYDDDYARMIAETEAEIAQYDAGILNKQQAIAELENRIAGTDARLRAVAPPAGANLDSIRSAEALGQTEPWLVNQTGSCVRHVVQQLPIPVQLHPPNAKDWLAMPDKYPTYGITAHDEPRAGSVLVMQPEHKYASDTHGHVMYVTRVENGEVWVTDNAHANEVRLSKLTKETSGPTIKYLYFPWHTRA